MSSQLPFIEKKVEAVANKPDEAWRACLLRAGTLRPSYGSNHAAVITVDRAASRSLEFAKRCCMRDIHEVLRRKRSKYAQLAKEIELLEDVAAKLRAVAPLLADSDEDENLLVEMEEEGPKPARAMSAVPAAEDILAAHLMPEKVAPNTSPASSAWVNVAPLASPQASSDSSPAPARPMSPRWP